MESSAERLSVVYIHQLLCINVIATMQQHLKVHASPPLFLSPSSRVADCNVLAQGGGDPTGWLSPHPDL